MLVESVVEPACPVLTPKYHLLTLLVADSSHTAGWHGEWQRAAFPFSSSEHPQHAPKFTFSGKVTAWCSSGTAGVSNDPGESDDPGESEMGMARRQENPFFPKLPFWLGVVTAEGFGALLREKGLRRMAAACTQSSSRSLPVCRYYT